MSRQFIDQLAHGDLVDEVYLLADKQLRANRNADLYLLTQLRDRTGQISGLMWNANNETAEQLETGGYARIRGKAQIYQGQMQVIVTHISPASEALLDPKDFLPEMGENVEENLTELHRLVGEISNDGVRSLLRRFLDDQVIVEGLRTAPAGIKLHHAYPGGLLEHIVMLMKLAATVAPFYPQVNTDLLVAGAFLHDIGKLRELAFETAFSYTDEGQLIGHMAIGIEMLEEKLLQPGSPTEAPLDDETILRLKHMIISHHGSYEYGSSKLPMTPEAIALTHLDNLDAKINEFTALIEGDPNSDSSWTPYNPNLQRKLFKGSVERT